MIIKRNVTKQTIQGILYYFPELRSYEQDKELSIARFTPFQELLNLHLDVRSANKRLLHIAGYGVMHRH